MSQWNSVPQNSKSLPTYRCGMFSHTTVHLVRLWRSGMYHVHFCQPTTKLLKPPPNFPAEHNFLVTRNIILPLPRQHGLGSWSKIFIFILRVWCVKNKSDSGMFLKRFVHKPQPDYHLLFGFFYHLFKQTSIYEIFINFNKTTSELELADAFRHTCSILSDSSEVFFWWNQVSLVKIAFGAVWLLLCSLVTFFNAF